MTTHSNVAPVIIKRKKIIAGGGHHGGAWKVAYADFVTAMMAFFMLMWLLNATTEQQRKGIADYFSPTFAINRTSGGGDSSFVGDSVFTENTLTRQGIGASTIHPTESIGSRYEKSETMIQAGFYSPGQDPALDEAVKLYPDLDAFIGQIETGSIQDSFQKLRLLLRKSQSPKTVTK
jgi:flagellar motor protein MotB